VPDPVLVTGGTGFIGGWCVRALLEHGHDVRTTVRDPARAEVVRRSVGDVDIAVADLTDDAGWAAAVDGCAAVLHVASPLQNRPLPRDEFARAARDGTVRVLGAAIDAGVPRVVMTSAAVTARAPGSEDRVSDETTWADPDDPRLDDYRWSKVVAERAAWDLMAERGGTTELTTVLPGAVFGPVLRPDDLGSVAIVLGLLHGLPPAVPRLSLSIVDVRDVADLHVRALAAPAAAGERFVAVSEPLWMVEICSVLRERLGDRAAQVPTDLAHDEDVRRQAEGEPSMRMLVTDLGHRNLMSAEKARRVLGWTPRPAAETLVDTAESLLAG
jgi:nucleoside-diphosphate-sugar epimerase